MKLILEKFVIYFDEIYGDQEQKFLEEDGRRKKLWRGDSYNTRGEKQLSDYLDYYHLEKGYMLSFNFNKKKEIGVRDIVLGGKILIEAVV